MFEKRNSVLNLNFNIRYFISEKSYKTIFFFSNTLDCIIIILVKLTKYGKKQGRSIKKYIL